MRDPRGPAGGLPKADPLESKVHEMIPDSQDDDNISADIVFPTSARGNGSPLKSLNPTPPVAGENEEIPAFSLRTKACIYASAVAAVFYIIYNYWHLILMCIMCLILYEVWDKFGHKWTASKKKSE